MKAPGFGENRKASLHDLAVLTGGQVSLFLDSCLFLQCIFSMLINVFCHIIGHN